MVGFKLELLNIWKLFVNCTVHGQDHISPTSFQQNLTEYMSRDVTDK